MKCKCGRELETNISENSLCDCIKEKIQRKKISKGKLLKDQTVIKK